MSEKMATPRDQAAQLLETNLQRVFNEHDAERRDAAIAELYVAHPVMYEPDTVLLGRSAISEIAGQLQKRFGATFGFRAQGAGGGHHGLATLRWVAGTADDPTLFSGSDIAEVVDGRISRLWVTFDPSAGSGE